jgi:hypothetical protein
MSAHPSNIKAATDLRDAFKQTFGEYPDGRLNPDDLGATPMKIASEKGRVVLEFPRPVAWIGLTGEAAFDLAKKLIRHAREAGGISLVLPRKEVTK